MLDYEARKCPYLNLYRRSAAIYATMRLDHLVNQTEALFRREHCFLVFVHSDGDDESVTQRRGSTDDV